MFCRILSGAGENTVLLLKHSSDLGADSVLKWVEEYNKSVEPCDAIKASRVRFFPERPKELFWARMRALRWRCLSISTRAPYDVHTTAGDALSTFICHLCIKEGEQMWQRNVAAGLVEEVGMGPFLIANGEDDAVCRGILWLLNPDLIRAGSEHLERCQREQSGYFNRESVPKDLEAGLVEAFKEVVRAKGDRTALRDIDLRKNSDRPAACKTFVPPGVPPIHVIGEKALDMYDRLMNQITGYKLSFKGMDFLFHSFVMYHFQMGFIGMHIIGFGSSVLCIKATYRGDDMAGTIRNGQELVIKAVHFTKGRARQENRIRHDAIVTALRFFLSADLRRGTLRARILPNPLYVYQDRRKCAAGFVRYDRDSVKREPAKNRPLLCFGAFELISEGSLHASGIVKDAVSKYRDEGTVSSNLIRIVQAIFFATKTMNDRQCFIMDISWANMALREIDGKFIVTFLDTGGSTVISTGKRNDNAKALVRCSTSYYAGPNAGPLNGKPTPHLGASKQSKQTSVGCLSDSKIREIFALDPSVCRTCSGTPTYRDEQLAEELDSLSNSDKILDPELACRIDFAAASMSSVQLFHRAPRESAARAKWLQDVVAATKSKEAMLDFLLQGIEDPNVRANSCSDMLLCSVADVFHKSLREKDRITVLDALISKAISCKVFSPSQKEALEGAGIPLLGGEIICPAGCSNEDWQASKWAGFTLPPLTLKEEFNTTGVSMGAGVQTPIAISYGDLIGFYAGTEASANTAISTDELPPCRYTAYAMDGESRLHVVADQPVEWFLERKVVGPFLNGVVGNETKCNVYLARRDYFRSNDGILYIAMYASSDIAAGEFLRWRYDPRRGAGGVDSYMFPMD